MVTAIQSFGYRYGAPNGGAPSLDVRTLIHRNPYHVHGLRDLTGKDEKVQAWLERWPGYETAIRVVVARAQQTDGVLWIGCTGGKHRSVAVAIMVGSLMGVPVYHRDIGKGSGKGRG